MSDLTNGRSAILIGHTGRFQAIDSVYVDGIPTALGGDGGDDTARDWTLLSGVALVAFLPTSQIPAAVTAGAVPSASPSPIGLIGGSKALVDKRFVGGTWVGRRALVFRYLRVRGGSVGCGCRGTFAGSGRLLWRRRRWCLLWVRR